MLKLKTEFWLGMASILGVIILIGLSFLKQILTQAPQSAPSATSDKIAPATLALHKQPTDCWIAVLDVVYNLTSFADSHSGGAQAIRDNCGTDATTVFVKQHDLNLLKFIFMFKVGDLAK